MANAYTNYIYYVDPNHNTNTDDVRHLHQPSCTCSSPLVGDRIQLWVIDYDTQLPHPRNLTAKSPQLSNNRHCVVFFTMGVCIVVLPLTCTCTCTYMYVLKSVQ